MEKKLTKGDIVRVDCYDSSYHECQGAVSEFDENEGMAKVVFVDGDYGWFYQEDLICPIECKHISAEPMLSPDGIECYRCVFCGQMI